MSLFIHCLEMQFNISEKTAWLDWEHVKYSETGFNPSNIQKQSKGMFVDVIFEFSGFIHFSTVNTECGT